MSETERRYAQFEKEALATTWACEKFANFLIAKHFLVETDHKPLVPLLGVKHLDTLPPRVLRFRLRLDRFDNAITHIPGKELYTSYTLSRATKASIDTLQELAEICMIAAINHLPASDDRRTPNANWSFNTAKTGGQQRERLTPQLGPTWVSRENSLSETDYYFVDTALLYIPKALQKETLEKLHDGHQGMVRCHLRAKSSIWWPGLSKQLTAYINACPVRARTARPREEPLIPTPLPEYLWLQDLFTLNGSDYLVIVDYFSR